MILQSLENVFFSNPDPTSQSVYSLLSFRFTPWTSINQTTAGRSLSQTETLDCCYFWALLLATCGRKEEKLCCKMKMQMSDEWHKHLEHILLHLQYSTNCIITEYPDKVFALKIQESHSTVFDILYIVNYYVLALISIYICALLVIVHKNKQKEQNWTPNHSWNVNILPFFGKKKKKINSKELILHFAIATWPIGVLNYTWFLYSLRALPSFLSSLLRFYLFSVLKLAC